MFKFFNKINLFWWTIRLGFETSFVFYLLRNFISIIDELIPIAITFIISLIINSLIYSLAHHITILTDYILTLIILSIILRLVFNITSEINHYLIVKLNSEWDIIHGAKFLEKISSLDFQQREDQTISLLYHKVEVGIDKNIKTLVLNTIPDLILNLAGLLVIAGIFLTLNPVFIMLIIIPIIINFIIDKKYGNEMYNIWKTEGENKIHVSKSKYALQNLNSGKEAKIYNINKYLIEKYKYHNKVFQKEYLTKSRSKTKYLSLSYILDSIIFGIIQIWIILQVLNKYLSIGLYSFYIMNLNTIISNLSHIEYASSIIINDINYSQDYRDLLNIQTVIKVNKNYKLKNESPSIEFKNVSFKYPKSHKYVLKNVSFKINKGESIAIVGVNAAGKSTIVKLLARFYDVTEGEILIDNYNIKDINLESYYRLWGSLFQEYSLFWFSIKENIAISNIKNINNINLMKSTTMKSTLDKDIKSLKYKYETFLDNEFYMGTNLSGGQKQKIAISRFLFKDSNLVILDEPTSAIDKLSEDKIFKEIYKYIKNKTTLIISHNFTIIKYIQKIIVLNHGEIVEQGYYEELMKNKGYYYKLYNTQAKYFKHV